MTFYQCSHDDILININYIENISIMKVKEIYEVRAHPPEGNYYLLESFDNIDEARKFLVYIIDQSDSNV